MRQSAVAPICPPAIQAGPARRPRNSRALVGHMDRTGERRPLRLPDSISLSPSNRSDTRTTAWPRIPAACTSLAPHDVPRGLCWFQQSRLDPAEPSGSNLNRDGWSSGRAAQRWDFDSFLPLFTPFTPSDGRGVGVQPWPASQLRDRHLRVAYTVGTPATNVLLAEPTGRSRCVL